MTNLVLEPQHKDKIRAQFNELKPAAREARLVEMRVKLQLATGAEKAAIARVIAYAESIHTQLCIIERPIVSRQAAPQPAHAKISILPEGWTPGKTTLFIGLSSGALAAGYFAIPALVAVITAIGTVIGYVIAAGFGFFFFAMFATELKSGYRSEKTSSGGDRIVNIHIEQNDR